MRVREGRGWAGVLEVAAAAAGAAGASGEVFARLEGVLGSACGVVATGEVDDLADLEVVRTDAGVCGLDGGDGGVVGFGDGGEGVAGFDGVGRHICFD